MNFVIHKVTAEVPTGPQKLQHYHNHFPRFYALFHPAQTYVPYFSLRNSYDKVVYTIVDNVFVKGSV